MAEKMLVTQALDERDLLVKKITDKIRKVKLVDTKRRNEDKTVMERVTVEDFAKAAIVASNAATWVETTYGRYTVAGAISLRNRLRAKTGMLVTGTNFEGFLQSVLEAQFSTGVAAADEKNKALEKQAEAMRLSILGKDGKARDDKPLGVVDAYVKENTTELVDPLGAEKRVAELKEKKEKLLAELETQIKVSNATTLIEF